MSQRIKESKNPRRDWNPRRLKYLRQGKGKRIIGQRYVYRTKILLLKGGRI